MWYKEQIQLAIMPYLFKGIKIGYKGQFTLKFQLVHESQQGTKTSAYPYIFKRPLPQQKQQQKSQNKKAKTSIENNQGFFQTSSFQVVYQNHLEYLHDMCIFKLENKMKKNPKSKTYLYIHLQSHRRLLAQNQKNNNLLQMKTLIKTVSTTKINLNRIHQQIYDFIQVQLQDIDYFGTVYMFIGSVHLGWKIRNNKMNLCQFLCQDLKQKKKMLQINKQYIKNQYLVGKCIRQNTKEFIQNIQQYYQQTVKKSIKQLLRLQKIYKQLQLHTNIHNNIQQYQQQLNFIQKLKSFQLQPQYQYQSQYQYLSQYYECRELNTLYFAIHYENNRLVDNIKYLWQKLLKCIQMLKCAQLEHITARRIRIYDNKWLNHSIKFINTVQNSQSYINNNKPNIQQNRVSNNNGGYHNALQLQRTKSTHSIFINQNQYYENKVVKTKKDTKPIQKYSNHQSNILIHKDQQNISIKSIRSRQIAKFKTWRKQHIQQSQIYSDVDLNHPYMIIQNYSDHISHNRNYNPMSTSLVVFIHGFKGSQFDLQRASQYLLKYNQNVQILRIKTLMADTDYQIDQMAKLAGAQIRKHILCSLSKIQSISIIGYSLGGIIGRAVLPYIQAYKQKLNLFITFSSPHLGTQISQNNLVKVGIWYMIKFNKCTVIQQLNTCRDFNTATKSYMKILSEQKYIEWFKKIILVSCQEDQFVPHISSRIEEIRNKSDERADRKDRKDRERKVDKIKNKFYKNRDINANTNSNRNSIKDNFDSEQQTDQFIENIESKSKIKQYTSQIQQMSENIRKYAKKIERVQVWFDNQNKKGTIDKLTGRQSHIQFLDNCRFYKMFFSVYSKQF